MSRPRWRNSLSATRYRCGTRCMNKKRTFLGEKARAIICRTGFREKAPRMVTVAAISQQIWDMKYRLRGAGRRAGRQDDRGHLAPRRRAPSPPPRRTRSAGPSGSTPRWSDFRFLPAGRVIAGAGAERQVTLFNCFVMGAIPDDMGGIFAHLREAALTMQQGGGIGYDFSTLRPRGAYVKGVGADASGPLELHGCVGRDVPHDHERRLSPRRDDGDAARATTPTSRPSSRPSANPAGCACSTCRCW